MTGRGQESAALPPPLKRVCARHIALAGFLLALTVLLLVVFRTPQCLLGLAAAAWLLLPALRIRRDYRRGEIAEAEAVCESIRYPAARAFPNGGSARAVFRTGEERLRFVLPGVPADLDAQARYRIYYRPSRPDRLVGYEEI